MLNKWLSELRVLLQAAADWSSLTDAAASNATGPSAASVGATAIPSGPAKENGSSDLVPVPRETPEVELDMRDVLIAKTRRVLDEAAEMHFQALYGAGVLIDWVIMGETVDPNLDAESDVHSLYVATSADMTSWKLTGMTGQLARYVYSGI